MKIWLTSGAVIGGLAVALGSFGAHGLKAVLEANGQAGNWETAVRYAIYHAVALLAVGIVTGMPQAAASRGWLAVAGWSFLIGTAIFSGCLATLALTGVRWLGGIVPIGGMPFLVGWTCLTIAALSLDAAQSDSSP